MMHSFTIQHSSGVLCLARLTIACCFVIPSATLAEDLVLLEAIEVVDEEEEVIIVDDGFEMAEANFEQWVFAGAQSAKQGIQRLDSKLKLRVEAIDHICGLTDSQTAKLHLAGQGDIKRFLDDVQVVRQKFLKVRRNRNAFNQIWQDIQPLQLRMNSGLFNDSSFFSKVLKKTLNGEQSSKQAEADWERRVFRYHAKLSLVMQMLERSMPLRDIQRKALLQVLKDETEPPNSFGQYDYYVVMYQMAKISDEKVKPILDEAQWKALQAHMQQARGMEQWLKQQKLLP